MCQTNISSILSNNMDLLNSLKGKIISRVVRYCYYTPDETIETYNVSPDEIFSGDEGPVLFHLDNGHQISFNADDSLNSITVFPEKDETGYIDNEPLEQDGDFYPIELTDSIYSKPVWQTIIGDKIIDFKIIKSKPISAKHFDLPNEVGLLLYMEQGTKLILSHNIDKKYSNFSIILEIGRASCRERV